MPCRLRSAGDVGAGGGHDDRSVGAVRAGRSGSRGRWASRATRCGDMSWPARRLTAGSHRALPLLEKRSAHRRCRAMRHAGQSPQSRPFARGTTGVIHKHCGQLSLGRAAPQSARRALRRLPLPIGGCGVPDRRNLHDKCRDHFQPQHRGCSPSAFAVDDHIALPGGAHQHRPQHAAFADVVGEPLDCRRLISGATRIGADLCTGNRLRVHGVPSVGHRRRARTVCAPRGRL